MTKSRIAMIVSLMFAAPAAVIALEQSASVDAALPSEPTEIQAATTEPATPAEPVVVVTEVTQVEAVVIADAPATAPVIAQRPAPAKHSHWAWTEHSFPKSYGPDDYDKPMLPGQHAYFDRAQQQRGQLIARHDAFPGAANEDRAPLPSTVAYFERGEQQRFASARPASTAQRSNVQARSSSSENAQAGSAEVAMAETSAIR